MKCEDFHACESVILVIASLLVAWPSCEATAQTRELKQGELRKATLTGRHHPAQPGY